MIHDDILQTIGDTPLVRMKGRPEILLKLESFNPGGSIKDRIGKRMIEDAEKEGKLEPGGTIVEATGAGNTGMGLALAGIVKGYKVILVLPDKVSDEKRNLLKAMGAKIIVCPTSVKPDDPRSYYRVAERIADETPNSMLAGQYVNQSNPKTHYDSTGPEIWEQTDGRITHLVAGMGTGGTITGTARFLKEKDPDIKVIGVDAEGSLYHHEFRGTKGEARPYKVEGIGEDFIPKTIDMSLIDDVIVVKDKDAFSAARSLAKEQGILAGGSSGAAVWAAQKVKGDMIVAILPDTGRNYLSKIFDDGWFGGTE